MIKNVPNEKFPFITCYARTVDRITSLPLTEFKDTLKNNEPWNFGIIKTSGGCSQYLIEFDIWNNEAKVSGGSTQRIFNDAKNCRLSVYKDRNKTPLGDNIIIKIKDSFKDSSLSNLYDSFDIYGNIFNKKNILSGRGEHSQIKIAIDIIDEIEFHNNLNFVVCFEYEDQGITVELFFDCILQLTETIIPLKRTIIGDKNGVFSGTINNVSIYNGIIEAYNLDGKLQDQQILNSNEYKLFLKNGIYNFLIKTANFQRNFNNVTVNGINQFYSQIESGLIKEIYEDTVRYYDVEDGKEKIITEICGKLVNEYNEPLIGANIIISNKEELITYFITDENGNYKFELSGGNYDIRLVSNERSLKIIRDFLFDEDYGFFSEIQYKIYNFNKDFCFTSNY